MKKFIAILLLSLTSTLAFALPTGTVSDLGGDEPFLKEFRVAPNPSQGEISIYFSAVAPDQIVEVKVFNLIGQEMVSEKITTYNGTQKVDFNLSNLPKGMYMVEISNGKTSRTKRISII